MCHGSPPEAGEKAVSRALRSGARRIFGRHDGVAGRQFNRHYRALAQRLGPFDGISRDYASAVAGLWVQWTEAAETLANAQRLRKEGKGRRPSPGQIARLQKRAGLAWASYDAALKRLGEIGKSTPGDDPTLQALRARFRRGSP